MKYNFISVSLSTLLILIMSGCAQVRTQTFHYTASSNVDGVQVYCGTSQNALTYCYTTPYDKRPYTSQMWSNRYFQGKKSGYKDSNIVKHPWIGNYQHAKVYFDMKEVNSNGYSMASAGRDAPVVGISPSDPSKIYHASNISLAKGIVERGEVNAKGMSEFTPLHNAAFTAPIKVLKYLLDNGAKLEALNSINQTPLFLAAKYAKPENTKYLIRRGANTNITDTTGSTILQSVEQSKKMWLTTLKDNPMATQQVQKYNEVLAILQNPPRTNKIQFATNDDINVEEKKAIAKVKVIDTILAYERFLAEYPNSKYAPTAKKLAQEKRAALKLNPQREKEILDKVMAYLEAKDIDGLLNYANDNEDVMEFVQNQPKIYLLFSGPKGLQVGKILQYKSRGLSENVLRSKIIANNKPYRNYSLDEIQIMMELGLTDTLLTAMLDVTTAYEKENRQYKAQQDMIKSQERISKQNQNTRAINVSQPSNTNANQNTIGDKVMDQAMEKGVEMLIKNLF